MLLPSWHKGVSLGDLSIVSKLRIYTRAKLTRAFINLRTRDINALVKSGSTSRVNSADDRGDIALGGTRAAEGLVKRGVGWVSDEVHPPPEGGVEDERAAPHLLAARPQMWGWCRPTTSRRSCRRSSWCPCNRVQTRTGLLQATTVLWRAQRRVQARTGSASHRNFSGVCDLDSRRRPEITSRCWRRLRAARRASRAPWPRKFASPSA